MARFSYKFAKKSYLKMLCRWEREDVKKIVIAFTKSFELLKRTFEDWRHQQKPPSPIFSLFHQYLGKKSSSTEYFSPNKNKWEWLSRCSWIIENLQNENISGEAFRNNGMEKAVLAVRAQASLIYLAQSFDLTSK